MKEHLFSIVAVVVALAVLVYVRIYREPPPCRDLQILGKTFPEFCATSGINND